MTFDIVMLGCAGVGAVCIGLLVFWITEDFRDD